MFRVWSLRIVDGCTCSSQTFYVSSQSLIDSDIDSRWIEQHAVKKKPVKNGKASKSMPSAVRLNLLIKYSSFSIVLASFKDHVIIGK